MNCSIYLISNSINDKIYIGQTWQTLSQRMAGHRYLGKSISKIQRAINKYGKDKFKIELIAQCSDQTTADYLEQVYIKEYDSVKKGYNISAGGSGHKTHSKETRMKISKAQKGKPRPSALGNKGGLGGAKLDYTNKTWKIINNKRVWLEK